MKKDKKPSVVEPCKKLLILSPAPNHPLIAPLISLLIGIKKGSAKYADKDSVHQPTVSNTSVSNGRLEALMKRMDCSLFAYIYCNKSSELRMIIGRTHEFLITDIIHYKIFNSPDKSVDILQNTLHALLMHRDPASTDFARTNLLLDVLRAAVPSAVGIGMVKYAIGLDVAEKTVTLDLLEIQPAPFKLMHLAGPMRMEVVEEHIVSPTVHKEACKQIRQTERKIKNIEKSGLNSTVGTLHIEKQDLRELQLSKGKALRGKSSWKNSTNSENV